MRATLIMLVLLSISTSACAKEQSETASFVAAFQTACLDTAGDQKKLEEVAIREGWSVLPDTSGSVGVLLYRIGDWVVELSGQDETVVHSDIERPDGVRGTAFSSPQVNCSLSGISRSSPAPILSEIAGSRNLTPFPMGRAPLLDENVEFESWGHPARLLLTSFYDPTVKRAQLGVTYSFQ